MLLNCCYCPYIRTILKYVHHFANIAYSKTKKTSVNTEVNEKSSIVVRLLRQPGRNAFTTSESIYDLYSKHENYKDSTSKSKEIHYTKAFWKHDEYSVH